MIPIMFNEIPNIKCFINSREKVDFIYTDLKKAFDTVNHNIFLAKLKYYGLNNHVIQ